MFPSYNYFVSGNESSLDFPKHGVFGPNIGLDGRDLTITFLSLNRAVLSIRLLESIVRHLPQFAGEILIVDNGSDFDELSQIKKYCAGTNLNVRFLELGKNFGVAGGRNRAFANIRTEWAMCLDNDIFFVANPIPKLQRDLSVTGAHFLSVPLLNPQLETLYAYGGILTVTPEGDRLKLSICSVIPTGSTVPPGHSDEAPMLCTFLYGGASVLKRNTFLAVGGYDESMLVGFEDLDFSLRAFRSGYKVGSSTTLALVHDHAKTDSDTDYERIRFSRSALRDAALYLEKKTGYRLWGDDVENWLRANEEKHGYAASVGTTTTTAASAHANRGPRRPVIALITDTDDWAFSRIARQIERHLGQKYEISTISVELLGEIPREAWLRSGVNEAYVGGVEALGMALVATARADITHVFWREYLNAVDSPLLEQYAQKLGLTYEEFRRRFIENRILSTAVYDHLFLGEAQIVERERIFNIVSAYYVSSQKLDTIYRDVPNYRAPLSVIQDGVDLELFKPKNLERFQSFPGRNLVVGWVGNSKWAASSLGDPKGLHTVLIPAVNALQEEGCPVSLKLVDRQVGRVRHEEMANYYSEIDVYVCVSEIEGTPNPVLEAMACGVPVISTNVGIVPEAFGSLQRQFILDSRTIEAVKASIRRLISEPDLLSRLSEENLGQIADWSWTKRVLGFERYFDSLLEKARVAKGENRTKICMLPFTTPSMETTGDIRLCSASSIFAYRSETNMGNCRADGLGAVWTGEKYRNLRETLFSGCNLTPYCDQCEYRFDGPAWFMRLHLGLHAYYNHIQEQEILDLIRTYAHRADEYRVIAPSVGVIPYPVPTLAEETPNEPVPVGLIRMPQDLRTGERLPIYLDLNTLNRCNVSCVMCPPAIRYDDLKEPKSPLYRLTLEEYKSITAGVRIASAHFVGAYAEPLMNKEIVDLVSFAHSAGAFTAITSNATLLSERMSNALVDAGLSMLSISLHGATKEIAEKIMRNSDFETVITNIRKLQEVKRSRGTSLPEIYFNYVGQCDNIDAFPAFIDLAADLGVKFVNLIHLIDGDEAVDETQNPVRDPENLIKVVKTARKRAEELDVVLNVSPAYATLVEERERELTAQD